MRRKGSHQSLTAWQCINGHSLMAQLVLEARGVGGSGGRFEEPPPLLGDG